MAVTATKKASSLIIEVEADVAADGSTIYAQRTKLGESILPRRMKTALISRRRSARFRVPRSGTSCGRKNPSLPVHNRRGE